MTWSSSRQIPSPGRHSALTPDLAGAARVAAIRGAARVQGAFSGVEPAAATPARQAASSEAVSSGAPGAPEQRAAGPARGEPAEGPGAAGPAGRAPSTRTALAASSGARPVSACRARPCSPRTVPTPGRRRYSLATGAACSPVRRRVRATPPPTALPARSATRASPARGTASPRIPRAARGISAPCPAVTPEPSRSRARSSAARSGRPAPGRPGLLRPVPVIPAAAGRAPLPSPGSASEVSPPA